MMNEESNAFQTVGSDRSMEIGADLKSEDGTMDGKRNRMDGWMNGWTGRLGESEQLEGMYQ